MAQSSCLDAASNFDILIFSDRMLSHAKGRYEWEKPAILTPEEIDRRMKAGIKRALSTPPSPTKELLGKTERAQNQRESRETRARRTKPKAL